MEEYINRRKRFSIIRIKQLVGIKKLLVSQKNKYKKTDKKVTALNNTTIKKVFYQNTLKYSFDMVNNFGKIKHFRRAYEFVKEANVKYSMACLKLNNL